MKQIIKDIYHELDADILCEGHFGIFQPGNQVRNYIETYKSQNQP